MQCLDTTLAGVKLLRPQVFGDARGFFMESYRQSLLDELVGREIRFVQDNHSRSHPGVLRGLHYQLPHPQGKLVWVARGRVLDVCVDLRQSSPTFGQYLAHALDARNPEQLWIPEGLAHGFLVLEGPADLLYKTTDYYHAAGEHTLRWDDPTLGIAWPLDGQPLLSEKDRHGGDFASLPLFP